MTEAGTPFVQRMTEERNALHEKTIKLADFLTSVEYMEELTPVERVLLEWQFETMNRYLAALDMRLRYYK